MFAEARFRTPWVDDEFAATIGASGQWLRDNPCPDRRLGEHFAAMLGAYAEMTNATVARVMELRTDIAQYVEAVHRWDIEISSSLASSRADRELRVSPERRATERVQVEGRAFRTSTRTR
jgi:hypothetical protein